MKFADVSMDHWLAEGGLTLEKVTAMMVMKACFVQCARIITSLTLKNLNA